MTKHNLWGSSEYNSWKLMKKRCYYPKHDSYPYYGAKGVTVCDRWKDSFLNFITDVGRKPSPKHTLDRINNNGNYEPGNVRWGTVSEQNRNKRYNIKVNYQGQEMLLIDLTDKLGIDYGLIKHRVMELGWNLEEALSKPANVKRAGRTWHKVYYEMDGESMILDDWCKKFGVSVNIRHCAI